MAAFDRGVYVFIKKNLTSLSGVCARGYDAVGPCSEAARMLQFAEEDFMKTLDAHD